MSASRKGFVLEGIQDFRVRLGIVARPRIAAVQVQVHEASGSAYSAPSRRVRVHQQAFTARQGAVPRLARWECMRRRKPAVICRGPARGRGRGWRRCDRRIQEVVDKVEVPVEVEVQHQQACRSVGCGVPRSGPVAQGAIQPAVAFLTTFSTAELQRQTVDVRRVA